MGRFTININGLGWNVERSESSSDCSSTFIYTVTADASDAIEVTITGDDINAFYSSDDYPFKIPIHGYTAFNYNIPTNIQFSLGNSGSFGSFDSAEIQIYNSTQGTTYSITEERQNDETACTTNPLQTDMTVDTTLITVDNNLITADNG